MYCYDFFLLNIYEIISYKFSIQIYKIYLKTLYYKKEEILLPCILAMFESPSVIFGVSL